MEQPKNNFVDIHYAQRGTSSNTDELGMREMQAKAYQYRDKRFLLIKAPPASGKSRALMFIALDKLVNQGIKKVVVAVPEKSIGRSFRNTDLKSMASLKIGVLRLITTCVRLMVTRATRLDAFVSLCAQTPNRRCWCVPMLHYVMP